MSKSTFIVQKPDAYGVAKINNKNKITLIKKTQKICIDLAITGLYFFDKNVTKYAKK